MCKNIQTMVHSKRKMIVVILIGIFVFSFVLAVIKSPDYFIQPTSPDKINRIIKTKKNMILVFYQPNCQDCRRVGLNILFNESKQQEVPYLNINTQKWSNRQYVKRFYVTKTPTIIRIYKGKIFKYSGVDKEKINAFMLKGI